MSEDKIVLIPESMRACTVDTDRGGMPDRAMRREMNVPDPFTSFGAISTRANSGQRSSSTRRYTVHIGSSEVPGTDDSSSSQKASSADFHSPVRESGVAPLAASGNSQPGSRLT
eukprot:1729741-Rhodomonas_salina.1